MVTFVKHLIHAVLLTAQQDHYQTNTLVTAVQLIDPVSYCNEEAIIF